MHSLTIEELMKQAGKQTYTTDSAGRVTGVQEYTPYEGDSCSWVYRSTASNTRSSGWLANSRSIWYFSSRFTTRYKFRLGAAQTGITSALNYNPNALANLGVTTPQTFGNQQATQYMSPYQQNVVDVQLAEARRQADIRRNQQALGSIGRGTFGGGRQALMASEADRNLATQLGQIQATGSQTCL